MYLNIKRSLEYVKKHGVVVSRQTFYEHNVKGYITADKILKRTGPKASRNVSLYKQDTLNEYIKWYRYITKLRSMGLIGINQLIKLKKKDASTD